MLQISNIKKSFGNVHALQDAYMNVEAGDIRTLLGSNGSGKSTVAKILGGLMFRNSGEIIIEGKSIEISSPVDSRCHGISVAYQDLSLVPQFSIEDNLSLGRESRTSGIQMMNKKKMREEAKYWLDRLNINASPYTLVEALDESTASLVEVAKALTWNPKILILDEVTACLHHDQVKRLFEVLHELKEQGLAIIIITHRFDEIFEICDTATILRNGETVAEVDIKDVNESELVYYMTGKRPEPFLKKKDEAEEQFKQEQDLVLAAEDVHIIPKVKGASLKVYSGEIVGICGLQGQGQSEFLRAIYGAQAISAGQIQYLGSLVQFRSPKQALKAGMGFISGDRQSEGIFPARSIKENIQTSKTAMRRVMSWINIKKHSEQTEKMVEKLKVKAGSIHHPASSLSGGNQQKLLFGRNFMVDLKLLLLDDPTKGVDISSRREIHQILRELTQTGTTVLISSSDHEELMEISDRIIVFYEGKITANLAVNENTEDALVSAMHGLKENNDYREKELG